MGGQQKERISTLETNDLKLFDKKSAEDSQLPKTKPVENIEKSKEILEK